MATEVGLIPVSVLEVRPGFVCRMREWFAAIVEKISPDQRFKSPRLFWAKVSFSWLAVCSIDVVLA
jgi:hypothetical protein